MCSFLTDSSQNGPKLVATLKKKQKLSTASSVDNEDQLSNGPDLQSLGFRQIKKT